MPALAPPPAPEVVVTAARLPPTPGDAAFSVVAVTPAQLRVRGQLDAALEDAVPGFSQFRRSSSLSANPTTQGVSLRSFAPSGAGRTLVTLDGVPQNDPFGGWVIWTALPAEGLDGAEVVRGAGAGPYGAGALTGVVALTERGGDPGFYDVDLSAGSLGYRRAAGAADARVGPLDFLLVASGEHDGGWIPILQGRGPADDRLSLDAASVALRAQTRLGAGVLAVRGGGFEEDRQAGLVGAHSRASGDFLSATWAAAPAPGGFGWRLQGWARGSNLANTSVSVPASQAFSTPADDQYKTPALGYGVDAALRRAWSGADVELGLDVRAAQGDDYERFAFSPAARAFTQDRRAGGRTLVAGAYLEADRSFAGWLVSGGIRGDYWAAAHGQLVQRLISTGQVTLDQSDPNRSGALPTARLGVRRALGGGLFVRAAAYEGFRPPTLNELYRPFRVGNNTTEANPDLVPERLTGEEVGVGGAAGGASWNLTAFANRLADAVTNVTIGAQGGGSLMQRRNAGVIDAEGLEGEARRRFGAALVLEIAADWTRARVDGGAAAPQLTGLRPAQAPALTAVVSARWRPAPRLSLRAALRYESARYDDDLDTRRLKSGTTVDVEARWRASAHARLFVAIDNLLDARVQTAEPDPGLFAYDRPLMLRTGVSLRR
ncbi:MAG TPA: TonB-dependent receptor [Caulobacteraceae bacterium]|nr:TonB-dependent receptor [Caulobacteraceae bacterium]